MTSPYRKHWTLDPEVVFLNHGSYGAVPETIQRKQEEQRRELEREPVRYMRHRTRLIDAARDAVAAFVGVDPADLVLVTNATHGVNSVLRSLRFADGDELLVTDHEYNACRNALNFVAERTGARVVVADVPFPLTSPQQVVDAMLAKVTDRTTLCLVDHITSPTALRLPIEQLVPALQERGVRVLVDGAHAPGQIELDLMKLGADFYTGNLHKWPCAPKGSALLFVHPRHRDQIRPTVISHGANADFSTRSRFHQEFDWEGTFDLTGWAVIPETLSFVGGLMPGGWKEVMQRNHALALQARALLCEGLGTEPVCPDEMIGTMASVRLPSDLHSKLQARSVSLFGELIDRWGIEVPTIGWRAPVGEMVRFSSHLHNDLEDYQKLLHALLELRKGA
ncbi:MAG: aminotransferase class V-fold PLP-dependent enzyme [Planctomycetota bacterium]|nr:aminotransferase class V-fold PLP-dependent enzyme [Planctomycetota bacterium]